MRLPDAILLEVRDTELTVTAAYGLIRRIAPHLHANRTVVLDLTRVEWIAPDLAERTFGPLTAAFGREKLLACLRVAGAHEVTIRAIAAAICSSPLPSAGLRTARASQTETPP